MFYRLVRLACEVESHTDRILDGTVPAAPPPGAGGAGTGAAAVHQDAGEVTATAREYSGERGTGDRVRGRRRCAEPPRVSSVGERGMG